MKRTIIRVPLVVLLAPSLWAGVPRIQDLKDDGRISITVMRSEPKITQYRHLFSGQSVTFSEDRKNLGKLVISAEDAVLIDQYLRSVENGKKAARNVLGAPVYTIDLQSAGKTVGTWTFRIGEPRASAKPALSLDSLGKRLEPEPAK